jgi:NAD(P)-dependent dehydrogenase (short-subunit alcohol dehydrogenase family)
MGTYVVSGGTKGIGRATVHALRGAGHTVVNVDITDGDVTADIGTKEGRDAIIKKIHELCPDGLDGFASNAGIASAEPLSRVLSVNYFGSVALMEGLYDLLRKKGGRCVATASGSIGYGWRDGNRYFVDNLLVNCGDEARIGMLVDTFDPEEASKHVYCSTKYALARWVRRIAPSWAVSGVNLNAVAPGGVATSIMDGHKRTGGDPEEMKSFAMPTHVRRGGMQSPDEIASAITFLLQEGAVCLSGALVYCDGGTDAVLHPEKV